MESREAVGACFRKTEVEAPGWTLHFAGQRPRRRSFHASDAAHHDSRETILSRDLLSIRKLYGQEDLSRHYE
jgi:hypothetical protein